MKKSGVISKKIIAIDGKSKVGKTTLAIQMTKNNPDSEVISLDKFRKNTNKFFVDIKINEENILNFINNYYDKDKILEAIKKSDRQTVIVEGCFIKSLELNFDEYIKIEEKENYNNFIYKIIKKKFKKIKKEHALIYIDLWNDIWKYYERNVIK